MSNSFRFVFIACLWLLSLADPTLARADLLIDSFRNPLAIQVDPCTGISGNDLWAGLYSSSCWWRTQGLGQGDQPPALSEVAGGRRSTQIEERTLNKRVQVEMNGNGKVFYTTTNSAVSSGRLTLEYGSGNDLNLDLSNDTFFLLQIQGNISNAQPIMVTVTIKSGASGTISAYSWYMTGSSYQALPFANFSMVNGVPDVDWHDVDYLKFEFSTPNSPGINYALIPAPATIGGKPCGLCTVRW